MDARKATVDVDPVSRFAFLLGETLGSTYTDDIKGYLLDRGVTPEEIGVFRRSCSTIGKAFYQEKQNALPKRPL